MTKATEKQDDKIAAAILRLAATRAWQNLTLEQMAKAAKITPQIFKKRFADKYALLPLLVDYVTRQAAAAGEADVGASPKDQLFEAMMARIDVLQQHRKAILSLAEAARGDRRMLLILAPLQIRAMKKQLEVLRFDAKTKCSRLVPPALWAIYLATLRVWKSDETLDMSKTMAVLDRNLRLAHRAAIFFRMQ